MNRNTVKKIGEKTLELLENIYNFADAFIYSANSTKLFKENLRQNQINPIRIFDRLHKLEKTGYIKINKKQNNFSIELTQKGEIKLLEKNSNNKIDGKWRMLSFDIPEDMKNQRNQFRSAIKRIGFRQVQKSLWACPFVKTDKIEKVIKFYKLKDYTAYLIVEKSDIELFLKELFKEHFSKSIKNRK